MQLVRAFLWVLAGTMVLQGYLHADEYGTTASIFGGLALTMAVWRERIGDLFVSDVASVHIPIPRALVQSALQETMRHPDIHTVPALQQTLEGHQATWRTFRDAEFEWMLRHTNLVGAFQAEPEARALWSAWSTAAEGAAARLTEARAGVCNAVSAILTPAACQMFQARVSVAERKAATVRAARRAWDNVLTMHDSVIDVAAWWNATQQGSPPLNLTEFQLQLARLYDVQVRSDVRIGAVLHHTRHMSRYATENPWLQRLLESLLTGQVWEACLQHVRAREQRVRDIMVSIGVQELYHRFDQVLNASLRATTTEEESAIVRDWFTEMGAYAWWMTEDMPTTVRRCLRHEGGECKRIGPTEIAALTAQINERNRILKDGNRRLLLGLWNALPAVGLLFLLEIAVFIVGPRPQKVRGLIKDEPESRTESRSRRRYAIETGRRNHSRSRQSRLQEEIPERLDAGNRETDGGVGR